MPALIRKSPLVVAQHAAPLQARSLLLRRRTSFSSCHTSLERSAKCFESAVEARFHCGKGNAEHAGHLFNSQILPGSAARALRDKSRGFSAAMPERFLQSRG